MRIFDRGDSADRAQPSESRGAAIPGWMNRLCHRLGDLPPGYFGTFPATGPSAKESAVLMLFGPSDGRSGGRGEDVVLTERSSNLRSHAGQVSFPGGRLDPHDPGPVSAALREAREEVGLDAAGLRVVAQLPKFPLTVTNYAVTPVLAWWPEPAPLTITSPQEVGRVVRAPLEALLEPANRFTVTHPSGYRGPGFAVDGLFIWGFTARLLDEVFDFAGLNRPWDPRIVRPLPARFTRPAATSTGRERA